MRDTHTEPLLCDDIYEALRHVVTIAGRPKAVGHQLWPAMSPAATGDKLLKCLNADEREKLSLEEVLFLLRLGREHGSHAGIRQLCRDAGYSDPSPIEPEDQKAALQREFIAHARRMEQLAQRIEGFGK